MSKGQYYEQLFILEAMKRGLNISRPISPELPYDFISDRKGLCRIQVKGTTVISNKSKTYTVPLYRGNDKKTKYSKAEIDYFALFIEPLNQWYILPVEAIKTGYFLTNQQWAKYIEAWNLL